MSAGASVSASRGFFGHPLGLGVVAIAQAAWYFSRYGAQSILVLYLAHALFNSALPHHTFGLDGLRSLLGWQVHDPKQSQALAAALIGTLAMAAIPVQILGGVFSDRWLGRYRGGALGLILLTVGPALWCFEPTFVLGLPCFVLGLAFAVNLLALTGDFHEAGAARHAEAFQLMALVQAGAVILGPIVCGGLAAWKGWSAGFAAAAVAMAIGTLAFLLGRRLLPAAALQRPRPRKRSKVTTSAAPVDKRPLLILALLLPILALAMVGNEQIYDSYIIWGEQHYARHLFGWQLPASWLLSLDASVSMLMQALAIVFWRVWQRRFGAPSQIGQIAAFSVIGALAPAILALASACSADPHQINMIWGLAFHIVNDFAMAAVMPISMALYVRVAPEGMKSTAIAGYALITRFSDIVAGFLGTRLPDLGSVAFWLAHSALITLAAVLLLTAARLFHQQLQAPAAPALAAG